MASSLGVLATHFFVDVIDRAAALALSSSALFCTWSIWVLMIETVEAMVFIPA